MFDSILNKIKECASVPVKERFGKIGEDCVLVRIMPKDFDGVLCRSRLETVSIARTYESALESFDRISDALLNLPSEDNDVVSIELKNVYIKYDTVSGMTRLFGVFECYTEVAHDETDL